MYILKCVQAGDRVLLYAYGKNGKLIYEYLKELPQIQVIGFVDRHADSLPDIGVPVYRPEQLRNIPADAYDKIVITVTRREMGREIYQIIRESGVAEEKIVSPYACLEPAPALSVGALFQDPVRLQRELETFIVHPNNNITSYFEPLIQELEGRKQEKDRLLPQCKELAEGLTPLENTVFLYVLYLAGVFDAELMKTLMECLLKIEQKELRQFLYGICSDTTIMCFLYPEYLFPTFYTMRRTLLKQICEMYDFHMKSEKIQNRTDGKIYKICILPNMLYGPKSSTTLQCIQLSGILADMGYEVMVLPLDMCGYMVLENPVFYPIIFGAYVSSRETEAYHKSAFSQEVSIEYTDEVDLGKKLQIELNKLAAFSPDLIIDMSDEHSILSYIYSQHFTTLYLPMRGYQSSSFFSYFGTANQTLCREENQTYHSLREDQIWEVQTAFALSPVPETEYQREVFSLGKGDFVLITVGRRLESELAENFTDAVCGRLLTNENIKWMVVGSGNKYLETHYSDYIKDHQIVYLPYENDLPALYQICDVYLNPPRMGGGTSIRWAMQAGLPCAVLSTPSDGLPAVGVENAAGDTIEEMMDYVLRLFEEPDFYQAESTKFRDRILCFGERQKQNCKDMIECLEKRSRVQAHV